MILQVTAKEEIESLHFKRWEIKKKYHTLKNKMRLESVTGKATLYIYKDFRAQIVVYNMIQDVLHTSNEKIAEEARGQGIFILFFRSICSNYNELKKYQ